MATIAKVLGLVLLVGGLLLWSVRALPPFPTDVFTIDLDERLAASTLPAAEMPVTLEGAVIFDDRDAWPVPFLEYREGSGVRTKQLIFGMGRSCHPSAGDLPCVPGFSTPVPDLSYGERIQVRGLIVGDQLFVEDYVHIE